MENADLKITETEAETTVLLHPRVMELLASRMCHDLVSPVGAVNNGIELMRDLGPDMAADALDLIESSIGQAAVRLKLFRLAYGVAGSEKQVGFEDIKTAFADWAAHGRTTVNWGGGIDFAETPKGFGKVLLNLLVLAEECNPGESNLDIDPGEDNASAVIHLRGKRPGLHKGMAECLTGDYPVEELDPRLVHAYVTGVILKYFGFTLTHRQISETELYFRVERAAS
ncbi:MAG: hypothetical protein EA357_02550 [Micavibrio sp.]|nr:MAG: hypothetical protein EA357_02550 [Micavibrio sp.]